jgi:Na+-transporting methylmalonyl-CoA/oxaloacetate decarboxylase gamma subunit
LLALGALLALSFAPAHVAGASTISISTVPTLKNVDPGTAAAFTLDLGNDGTVTDVITLEVTGVPKNWTAIFSDDSVELGAGKSGASTLTIKPTKDSRTMDAILNVSALSTVNSGKAYVNLKVHVNQIYKLDLQITPLPATTPGGTTTISATIRNDGNGQDHVTVTLIPVGASTSWASVASASYDIDPGQTKAFSQPLKVPSDTDPDRYQFTVRARSAGPDTQEAKTVDLQVDKGALSGIVMDMTTLLIVVAVAFIVLIILAAALTPKGKGAAKAKDSAVEAPKVRKVKKVAKNDDHKEHLDRIEKRIDELHDKVEKFHDNHRETMTRFDEHLAKHHGQRKVPEPLPPPPKPLPEAPQPPKVFAPSSHAEALKPEGPPENMSLGDEHGELKKKPEGEGLKTAQPPKAKCPKCGGDVETGWVKCPTCSAAL